MNKILWLSFLSLFFLISSFSAMAIENKYETHLECSGIQSKIISICHDEYHHPFCSEQQWIIGEHSIDLKKTQPTDFNVYEWACLPSKAGDKIILYSTNGGNCDTCERLTIWDLAGNKMVDWQKFDESYKALEFPDLKGEKFHNQFHPVALRTEK